MSGPRFSRLPDDPGIDDETAEERRARQSFRAFVGWLVILFCLLVVAAVIVGAAVINQAYRPAASAPPAKDQGRLMPASDLPERSS